MSLAMRKTQPLRGFPSPLWGGVGGGGTPALRGLRFPPTLSLPHKGGGDAGARSVSFVEAWCRRFAADPNGGA